jgi:pimeloyl-ACP methyl ester carboxylesterase
VLLVHAIGLDHTSWEPLVPHLAEDFRVAAVDLPGHGRSDKPMDADYGLRSMGARLVRFLDEIGWDDAILVGNSIGGGTALSAAVQAPERVRGLALLNSVGYRRGLPAVGRLAAVPLAPLVSAYTPQVAMRLGLESVRGGWGSVTPERCAACGSYFRDPEGRAAFFRTLRQLYGPDLDALARRYREIRAPTLVLHGERDPLIRLAHAERLAREIPPAELVPIPRCGHFPQEECPEEVAGKLRPFLERVGVGR